MKYDKYTTDAVHFSDMSNIRRGTIRPNEMTMLDVEITYKVHNSVTRKHSSIYYIHYLQYLNR